MTLNLKCQVVIICLFWGIGLATAEEQGTYNSQGRRDPFLPLVDEQGFYLADPVSFSPDELSLSGILWDPQGKSSALINNKMVSVGETIYGCIITAITQDSVTLSKDGKEYIISISRKGKEQSEKQKE